MQTTFNDSTPDAYRALTAQIRAAGLLEPRSGYYCAKISLTILALAAGWTAFLVVGNSWSTLGVAAFLGVMFTQVAMIGHDAGHQQVFRTRRANWLLGLLVGNALIGLSFGWWVPKHNAHHAHPNQIDLDPDVGNGLARWQAQFFFPLMLLRSTGMHFYGIQRLLRQRDRGAAVEASLIVLHGALYITALLWVLPPNKMLAFIFVQQGIFSIYLGMSFAPNHKGMPVLKGDVEMAFARRQVVTARNISGGRFLTLMFGGLNFQIEHHLFPTMPRPNLRRAQSMVRGFCMENGFGYSEASLVDSYRQIVRHLRIPETGSTLVPSSATP